MEQNWSLDIATKLLCECWRCVEAENSLVGQSENGMTKKFEVIYEFPAYCVSNSIATMYKQHNIVLLRWNFTTSQATVLPSFMEYGEYFFEDAISMQSFLEEEWIEIASDNNIHEEWTESNAVRIAGNALRCKVDSKKITTNNCTTHLTCFYSFPEEYKIKFVWNNHTYEFFVIINDTVQKYTTTAKLALNMQRTWSSIKAKHGLQEKKYNQECEIQYEEPQSEESNEMPVSRRDLQAISMIHSRLQRLEQNVCFQ